MLDSDFRAPVILMAVRAKPSFLGCCGTICCALLASGFASLLPFETNLCARCPFGYGSAVPALGLVLWFLQPVLCAAKAGGAGTADATANFLQCGALAAGAKVETRRRCATWLGAASH